MSVQVQAVQMQAKEEEKEEEETSIFVFFVGRILPAFVFLVLFRLNRLKKVASWNLNSLFFASMLIVGNSSVVDDCSLIYDSAES